MLHEQAIETYCANYKIGASQSGFEPEQTVLETVMLPITSLTQNFPYQLLDTKRSINVDGSKGALGCIANMTASRPVFIRCN